MVGDENEKQSLKSEYCGENGFEMTKEWWFYTPTHQKTEMGSRSKQTNHATDDWTVLLLKQ